MTLVRSCFARRRSTRCSAIGCVRSPDALPRSSASPTLCNACQLRFARFAGTVEEFVAIPRVFTHDGRAEQLLCMVCRTPGHERPAVRRNGLCESCDQARKAAGQTAEEYAADAVPRPSFGRCLRCERWAARRRSRLCQSCHARWREQGGPVLAEFAASRLWGAREASREVDLSALPERARLEILYGVSGALAGW